MSELVSYGGLVNKLKKNVVKSVFLLSFQDGLSLILVAVFSTFNRDKMIAMVQLLKNSFDLDTQALGEQLRDKVNWLNTWATTLEKQ